LSAFRSIFSATDFSRTQRLVVGGEIRWSRPMTSRCSRPENKSAAPVARSGAMKTVVLWFLFALVIAWILYVAISGNDANWPMPIQINHGGKPRNRHETELRHLFFLKATRLLPRSGRTFFEKYVPRSMFT